jgi:hypothetical protein
MARYLLQAAYTPQAWAALTRSTMLTSPVLQRLMPCLVAVRTD